MQYYDNGDLSSLIKRHKKLNNYIDETFIWGVVYQISKALHAFHSKLTKVTILYCDIRAAHVFFDNCSNLRLGGFCVNKRIMKGYDIEPEVSYDTMCYLSPVSTCAFFIVCKKASDLCLIYFVFQEVISGGQPGKKSEIWSLGCLIYELASLCTPFTGSTTQNLAENIQIGKRSKLPIHYSNDLQRIIDLMLSSDEESRPTAEAVLYHPLVVTRVTLNTLQQLSLEVNKKTETTKHQTCGKCKDMENKLEFFRQKEAFLKSKENRLKEKEFYLVKREKQLMLLEQLHREKTKKTECSLKQKYRSNLNKPVVDLNDSSYSADPGDTSILLTASKLNPNDITKPSFVRNNPNRKTVHFGSHSSHDYEEVDRFETINLDSKKDNNYNTKIQGKILKNQNRENHNKENRIPFRFRRGSIMSLKADTLETSQGILETHFI